MAKAPNILYSPKSDIRDYSKTQMVETIVKLEDHLRRAIRERDAAIRSRDVTYKCHQIAVQHFDEARQEWEPKLLAEFDRARKAKHDERRAWRVLVFSSALYFILFILVVAL